VALVVLGLAWAALALLDPQRPSGIMGGPAAAALGLLLAGRPRRLRVVLPAVLAAAAAVSAYGLPEFRGDSASYFAYVRSAVLDRDLDFANEWEHWGYPEPARTVTGLRQNVQSVGPAVLWTPFYLLAHAYVRLGLGAAPYPADGYSAPYRRAAFPAPAASRADRAAQFLKIPIPRRGIVPGQALAPQDGKLAVRVLKRRGGDVAKPVLIDVDHAGRDMPALRDGIVVKRLHP